MPSNLHPILVISMWYRLLMRIFVCRLSPELPQVMSPTQHGFCPGRSTTTALTSLLPALEYLGAVAPKVLCALDLHKAYDSVNCSAMHTIASHLGLTGNGFWMLMTLACDAGPVYITGTLALSA